MIKKAIVKPAKGGSSIGTFAVYSVAEALKRGREIFNKKITQYLKLKKIHQKPVNQI